MCVYLCMYAVCDYNLDLGIHSRLVTLNFENDTMALSILVHDTVPFFLGGLC